MRWSAGRFYHIITIERRSLQADDGYGNTLGGWGTVSQLGRIHASVEPVDVSSRAAKELLVAGQMKSAYGVIVYVRRNVSTRAITAESDRVVFQSTPYTGLTANIRAVISDPDNWVVGLACEMNLTS